MYPIQYAFDANFNTFKHFAEKMLDEHFPVKHEGKEDSDEGIDTNVTKTWSMYYRCRSNSKFEKQTF